MRCWGGYIGGGGDVGDGKSGWLDIVMAPIVITIDFLLGEFLLDKIILLKSDKYLIKYRLWSDRKFIFQFIDGLFKELPGEGCYA